LQERFDVLLGFGRTKRAHRFDLGSDDPKILVECKAHTWTRGGNHPSAKMSVWNEAMLQFLAAPQGYRKLLVALRSVHKGEALAERYVRYYGHLIPAGVEIWEYDPEAQNARQVYP
jgi:hypothetical protein